MRNFIYHNPTKIIFGENVLYKISAEIPANARIMLTYGGGSIKKNGIYHQVVSVLEDFFFIEFGGIEPNPQYSTLMKAVDLCRKEKIDFLLSVGGGSVLDGTKFIAAASLFDGEPWDILENQLKVTSVIPFGAVLTLPAT
jgi:NADP-dependent alcohol dehydrogenase